MSWTALVPMKRKGVQKSRLAGRLSDSERAALMEFMAAHVLNVLADAPEIARVLVLSPDAPVLPRFGWVEDKGRGLNEELSAFQKTLESGGLLIVHGDVPLLTGAAIGEMLCAAEAAGCAIAPDRHGTGTNALALKTPGSFVFAFGEGSFAKHLSAFPDAAVVRIEALSHDVDTPDDLEAARANGFRWDAPPYPSR
ncbi:MAG: 2-phospho-L-lactate guanylyltransferase [Caulobacterales bacterium]